MEIASFKATAVAVPIHEPIAISTRLLSHREYVIVELTDAGSGEVGYGYTYAGTSGARLLREALRELIAPIVTRDQFGIVELWDRLYQETLLVGRRGLLLRAISAVDIALWDLAAKQANAPLAVLLGGSRKKVPVYASGGYYRRREEKSAADQVRDEIEANRASGFTDHKIKVGGLSIAEDASRVLAACEVMGEGDRLALDANNAYRTWPEGLEAIAAFQRAAGDRTIWWFEEPFSADNVLAHAELVRRTNVPIATGELAQTRWEFQQLLSANAASYLQPDAGVLGGVTEWMRVVGAAHTWGVWVAPHWHANLHVHLAAAVPNCLAVEHFSLEKDIYNFESLLVPESRLTPDDGHVQIGAGRGMNLEFDSDRVAFHTIA